MTSTDRIRKLVDEKNFAELFITELGWDNPSGRRTVKYKDDESGREFSAVPVAQKKGVGVYACGSLLDRSILEKLDRQIKKQSNERLLITYEEEVQEWRLPVPRKSGGTRYVTYRHHQGENNLSLLQRLQGVRFTMDEEDSLVVLDVLERVRTHLSTDEVTNKFYEGFKKIQRSLMKSLKGIEPAEKRSWYSSLLLNRLMFIYFIQYKGFMNSEQNYLQRIFDDVRKLIGKDNFYSFYRDALIPLFHQGLGSEKPKYVNDKITEIIGKVPYINGGVFEPHSLELEFKDLDVPDKSFKEIFKFFDQYRWHLDERPAGNPEEINPEILGYIFEKYVNQKEMGAYYTKEDVTSYMSAMTILPVVLDKLIDALEQSPWYLLKNEPERYIPEGLLYGCKDQLPEAVASADPFEVGILDAPADETVSTEEGATPEGDLRLPGERWRETVARREYVESLRKRLANGEITSLPEAITCNLDLQTLALDWIGELGENDKDGDIAKVWNVLSGLKIVDPTCGSGAFLFAALHILDELYDRTLSMAEKAVANNTANKKTAAIAGEAESHNSREYYLGKRAVLNNLYGMDLMPEAIEIARLRLFLSLAARLDEGGQIEPFPDLEMNLRTGNLLVGCTTPDDVRNRFQGEVLVHNQVADIEEKAKELGNVYDEFIDAQQNGEPASKISKKKRDFEKIALPLRKKLDLLYSPYDKLSDDFEEWKISHHPFHWFIEFPKVMLRGGGLMP